MRGNPISINGICNYLKEINILFSTSGDTSGIIDGFCALKDLHENSMTWIRKGYPLPLEDLNNRFNILLFAECGTQIMGVKHPVIFVDDVHRTFFRVSERFFGELNPEKPQQKIESSAIVETDSIGTGVYIGHHTYISKEAIIGNRVTIMHNVTIEGNVIIGSDTFIESGTVIGGCGFGYMVNEEGKQEIVPHYAGVVIGNNVRIGANNTISRGCLSDTIIEDEVKTADLVCISHNDLIKRGTMIACGTAIAGSTTVGESTWIAPGAAVNNNVDIGEKAYLGIGSVVVSKIRKGIKVFGNPAKIVKF